MKKKLAFLAASILALGLIASPVKAEPRVNWESHKIVTKIEEVTPLTRLKNKFWR